jgi:hypothetical protein
MMKEEQGEHKLHHLRELLLGRWLTVAQIAKMTRSSKMVVYNRITTLQLRGDNVVAKMHDRGMSAKGPSPKAYTIDLRDIKRSKRSKKKR